MSKLERFYGPSNYRIDENGCWRWLGNILDKGYGYFNSFSERAHRKYYERYVGAIQDGMQVLHTCDVKDCVNPKHLKLGTHTDNMQDASKRGQLTSPARLEAIFKNRASGREKGLATRRENAVARRAAILAMYK